jgi:hypothetical protein
MWIAQEMNENVDDVYDVLLGNLTRPWEFYAGVETMSMEYDRIYDKMVTK